MDESRRRFAAELYTISREHDQAHENRLERFRNVEPPTAELLGVLIRATRARRILELGTSNGSPPASMGASSYVPGRRAHAAVLAR